jgi:hypothetical protein
MVFKAEISRERKKDALSKSIWTRIRSNIDIRTSTNVTRSIRDDVETVIA